jgi:hypothetical protein
MELTLKNYAKVLSKDLLLPSKKNQVRECDETQKGHFVAYVDEGSESFDVSLELAAGGKIARHACDCSSSTGFCRHKAALLIYIANGKKEKSPIKIRKKESKADTLLEAAGTDELKAWLRGVIEKNKDIQLSFIHHFSVKELLTPADVTRITTDAIKAVAGNKKTVDQTQLKKLVELWSEMHAPVITHYQANPADEKSFVNFHTVLESCLDFQVKADTSSNRVPKFVEVTLQKSQEAINNLHNEQAWEKAVGYFIDHVPEGAYYVRMHYLVHLKNIIAIGSEDRKIKIIDWLAKQFKKAKPDEMSYGIQYSKFIFDLIAEQGLFPAYYTLFKPIRFDNDYNERLISLLIENNQLDMAKKYCNEQIKGNYREEYNVPYLKSLKEIFVIQNDQENLAKVLSALFPYTFQFDDYLFIIDRLPDEEKKKWRTKILARARNAANGRNSNAIEFCFQLMNYEKNYRKLIECIDSHTPFTVILRYFEPMVQGDKTRLLEAILRKSDDSWFESSANAEKDAACFPELFALVKKHYPANYLTAALKNAEKNKWSYLHFNRFIVYMKKQPASD